MLLKVEKAVVSSESVRAEEPSARERSFASVDVMPSRRAYDIA